RGSRLFRSLDKYPALGENVRRFTLSGACDLWRLACWAWPSMRRSRRGPGVVFFYGGGVVPVVSSAAVVSWPRQGGVAAGCVVGRVSSGAVVQEGETRPGRAGRAGIQPPGHRPGAGRPTAGRAPPTAARRIPRGPAGRARQRAPGAGPGTGPGRP